MGGIVIQDAGWIGSQHLMVRALSNDLRERVVAAIAEGESCRTVAERFGVAASSVMKWSQRYRATGSVAAGKMGGHRELVLVPHRAFIIGRLGRTPHLTLHALKQQFTWRRLARQPVVREPAPEPPMFVPAVVGTSNPPSRPAWPRCAGGDERASVCAALRRTDTAYAGLPRRAALRSAHRLGVFDGPINGGCFCAYVEQQLVPILKPGNIVVMDTVASLRHGDTEIAAVLGDSHVRDADLPGQALHRLRPDQLVKLLADEREGHPCILPAGEDLWTRIAERDACVPGPIIWRPSTPSRRRAGCVMRAS